MSQAPPKDFGYKKQATEVERDARDARQTTTSSLSLAKPKFEKKGRFCSFIMLVTFISKFAIAPSQITLGYGGSSTTINRYGVPKNRNNNNNQDSPSCFTGETFSSSMRQEKEYKEPCYYDYYPTTLPLRRPYAGNPEILDEEEFGEYSKSTICDESLAQSAIELGLLMVERQLKAHMHNAKQKPCALNELPAGFMGKMLMYESGAITLKIGETLYDWPRATSSIRRVQCDGPPPWVQRCNPSETAQSHCPIVMGLTTRPMVPHSAPRLLQLQAMTQSHLWLFVMHHLAKPWSLHMALVKVHLMGLHAK
ncbi:hypothetical protein UlMin_018621 [Ulmus minor]